MIPGVKKISQLIRGEELPQVEKLDQQAKRIAAEQLLQQAKEQPKTPESDRKSLKNFVVPEKGAQPQENSLAVEGGTVGKASLQRRNDERGH